MYQRLHHRLVDVELVVTLGDKAKQGCVRLWDNMVGGGRCQGGGGPKVYQRLHHRLVDVELVVTLGIEQGCVIS